MRCHQTALMSCRLTAEFVVIGMTGVGRPESGRIMAQLSRQKS